jgi:hypothetical protein
VIEQPEAFKHAMLAAKSIAYSTGASRIIVAKLMEQLGIAEQLKDKIKLVDGVPVAEIVARGKPRSACSRSTSSCPLPAPTTSVRCRRSSGLQNEQPFFSFFYRAIIQTLPSARATSGGQDLQASEYGRFA